VTLLIPAPLIAELMALAANAPEVEICGLLLGQHNRVAQIEPARNVAEKPHRQFEIDPAALIAAHRRAREGGDSVIGHYHSHPNGRTGPSPRDQTMAAADGQYWVIIAEQGMSAWLASDKGLIPQPILPC
jgi:desampylase